MLKEIVWKFPLPRTHTGIALGNATTGLLVWGENNHLKITIARADLWDNRGGMSWTEKQNYFDIKKHLEANDEPTLREIFKSDTEDIPGQPRRPSVVPVGRLDLYLPEGSQLKTGILNLTTAEAQICYLRDETEYELKINLSVDSQRFCIGSMAGEKIEVKSVPSWEFLGDYFTSISMKPPVLFKNSGWAQELPENNGVCVAYRQTGNVIYAISTRDETAEKMYSKANSELDIFEKDGTVQIKENNMKWWGNYWHDIPEIEIPNEKLDICYSYGLYKFACLTNPVGTPATLQGPWIEEYAMPPWSSDYHFNINVQMCYWPAYKANRLEHLRPLFDMIWSWREHLRANARAFAGIDDGFMMPHAVDDKCTCMGGFWTGTIDHACSAWIAQMMYQYFEYTGDRDFLEKIAYPFMKGTMRVFEVMLEKDGNKLCLPVSVSPEYRGGEMNAWGKNASFQLSAVHRLCEYLISAADELGDTPAPIWQEISEKLPPYTLIGEKGKERIALWEGTDLEESHRHHSHLGAICPFDTIDIFAPENVELINRTIQHWIYQGPGLWSGWSLPWASMLYSRMHNGDMAEQCLEILTRIYMNKGYGTLHDCLLPGFSNIGAPVPLINGPVESPRKREIMQLDAGMGAVTAVQDMLMHSRRGIVYIFPGIPSRWENASFSDIPCEGGFLVSAQMIDSILMPVTVKSNRGGKIRIGNPWRGKKVIIEYSGNEIITDDDILEIDMSPNSNCSIQLKQ